MGITGDTITNFLGGVSQQPDKLMYPSQAKSLTNCLLSPTEGLCKRPPSEHTACLISSNSGLTIIPKVLLCHTIIKEDEKYEVILTGSDWESVCYVFDLEGNKKTVNVNASDDYCITDNPLEDLGMVTIADYTFIWNKTVTVELLDDLYENAYPESALIFVSQGSYECPYKVTVNDTTISYTTTSDNSTIQTNTICTNLYNSLVSALGTTDWNITQQGSVIAINRKDGAGFTIVTEDGNSDYNLFVFYGKADSLNYLPLVAPDGFILKIIGEDSSKADDYYVKFETNDGSTFGNGSWIECPAPDIQYKLNPATMPHALIREADGTFTLKTLDWTARRAGDEESAPTPPFVGETIRKVFTHKGRLAFLAGDRSFYSDTQDIFSFFRKTVLTTLDTDPIDVGSNSQMVLLNHALPFNEELLLFSEKSEFSIKGGDVFSNSTVTCDLTMQYPCSKLCEPVNAGGTAFFVFENGKYSRVNEAYITSTYTIDARDITEQVPSYLPQEIYKIAVSTANNIALFLSREEEGNIYCYNYYYSSEKKAQSAWHKWSYENTTILNADFDENWLYLVTRYDDGVYLEKINFMPKNKEDELGLDFLFYLDRKTTLNRTYYRKFSDCFSSGNEGVYTGPVPDVPVLDSFHANDFVSQFTIPYTPVNEITVLDEKGFPLEFYQNGKILLVFGDYETITVGNTYNTRWEMSTIYVRQTTETGGMKVKEGTLMLRDINLSYANTGYFRITVTPEYTTNISSEFEFTGKEAGLPNSTLEQIPISSAAFLLPVIAKNEEINIIVENDSYLPSFFLSLEWLGDFVIRGQ